jgi:hypothetical protein
MSQLNPSDGYYFLDGTSTRKGYEAQCNSVPVSFSETYNVFDSQWLAFNSHDEVHNQELAEKFKFFRTDANMYGPCMVDFKPIQLNVPCIAQSNDINLTPEPKYFDNQASIHEANQLISQGGFIDHVILGSSSYSSADLSCHVNLSTNPTVPLI